MGSKERLGKIDQQTALNQFKRGYEALQRADDMPLKVQLKQRLLKAQAVFVWPLLPTYIVAIQIGENFASRPSEEVERISEDERVTWSLEDVEAYGKRLASHYGLIWE